MNSKILLVIIILIAVFGAFTFLGNKNTTPKKDMEKPEVVKSVSPTQAAQENMDVTAVALTDAGFTPKDITVKVGALVSWTNKSGKSATVSSDDHPSHRLYPFLNLGEFADGSSVQVVFDKAGTYTYHDHYNSSETGSVTVK